MESGSSTDDSDYETYLYSLLHYSWENQLEENYRLPGSSSSERMSVDQSGSSEVVSSFYQSKRSKVSRWDMVKSLPDTSDEPPYNGRTATLSSGSKNKRVIRPGEEQKIQNNYSSLLHAYKEARSSCMQSTAAKEQNLRKTYAEYRCRNITEKETGFSSASNVESKKGKNAVTVSNSFFQDSVPIAVEKHTSVLRSASTYINSSTDNSHFNNYTYDKSKCSKSQNSNNKDILNDGDRNKNWNCEVRNKLRDNRHEQLEGKFSKYNLCLNKEKQNSVEESVIVLDSSDSDTESVVEVEPPVRDPPPVVSLSSDEEALNNMPDEKRPKKVSVEDDIVVLYTSDKINISAVWPAVTDSDTESVGSVATVVLNGTRENSEKKRRKRRKKKKQKKVAENGGYLERSLNSVFQTSPLTSKFICPKSWSKDMSHFYNDSWGGEKFDVRQLQKYMSDNPANWQVLRSDIVSTPRRTGPDHRKKCNNCNIWGHTPQDCPDRQKPIVCLFCGKTGHSKHRCPTTICLNCGKPAKVYRNGCPECLSPKKLYQPCSVCNKVDHPPSECPELWRRYHATTTSKDLGAVCPRILYKPQEEQFCSNCARRGHLSHECRSVNHSYAPSHNSLKRRSAREHNRMPAKRRKHNNHSAKMSSFNLYIQPWYDPI